MRARRGDRELRHERRGLLRPRQSARRRIRCADTFSAHYKKGLELIDPRRTVTARKVLGLTTNPPSNDEGGGGRGNGGSGGGLEV
ncbi:hypothetical protein [Streptomyces mirabilis]|uniref:hypothetical protein n=1 Tax=Streptomyces mirabilis TaxID=68239 RepID=UPI0022548B12|nr:hypothetical protein [Streptomyces mirabilis]MCX4436335.1 hypothetical protein [Streptomyces mirabilis]